MGWVSSRLWGGVRQYSPLASPPPPPKRAQLTGRLNPTKIDPWAWRRPGPKIQRKKKKKKKKKMGFLESVRRRGSEKSSFGGACAQRMQSSLFTVRNWGNLA